MNEIKDNSKKDEYKTKLYMLSINAFNFSYNDLINNYLLDELIKEISIVTINNL